MSVESLGSKIRRLRHDAGHTLAQLSERAGISHSYLNDIEHDRTVPTLHTLGQVARSLGMSVVDVLEGVAPYDSKAGPP